jgi:hypothetical protein
VLPSSVATDDEYPPQMGRQAVLLLSVLAESVRSGPAAVHRRGHTTSQSVLGLRSLALAASEGARPRLCLRGGALSAAGEGPWAGAAGWDATGDLIDLQEDSSDIHAEGTAEPGAGVTVEEGYREKDAWLDVPEEHRRVEQLLCPTWEQAVQEREQWLAEHPDYVEPLNDTWFFEVRRGNVTTLRELLHRGADVESPDEYGDRAIHLAAMDNSTAVLRLLLSAGASINARNKNGNTALHIATECGQTAMLQQLIAAGADIEVRNRAKATAVVTACVHGQVEALRVLAAAGYTFSKVLTTLNLLNVDTPQVLGALTFENSSQRRRTHSCAQGHAGAAFRCGKQPRGGGACDDRAGRGC